MKRSIFTLILLALATTWQHRARADDIDVFTGASIKATPNVLFVIDNTANWNTVYTNEIAALSAVFNSLPVNSDGTAIFNIGIMFATETGNGNSNTSGGYVRAAIRPMTAANKVLYAAMINNFNQTADKANGGRSAMEMVEAYLYLSGGAPYAGSGKVKADFLLNLCPSCGMSAAETTADKAVWALPNNALASENAIAYTPPAGTSGCTRNFIIYISNGPNQENASADATANSMLAALGGDTTQIPISPAGSATNPSDEWARFMKQSSLGVVTYTIDVNPPSTGQGPGWTALLKSMSSVSAGKYQAVPPGSGGTVSASSISAAIRADLSEIQAVNSVYASVSLPASANTQGTYLNQVYVGMFRPDANAAPLWYGNLKQYQMGFSGTTLQLEDAAGTSAINNQTGFITQCARSFWTPTTVDTYWTFSPEGSCIPPASKPSDYYANSDFPDGNIVEKGGAGYLLRCDSTTSTCANTNTNVLSPPAGRLVYTCSTTFSTCASTSALTQFTTSNGAITATALGLPSTTTTAQVQSIIQWERGLDVLDENNNAVTTTEMRPSAHGDVVHSRPIAINYGTTSSPNVAVFYGDNDGALHAINGNQSSNFNGVLPGGELWAFVPPEFYPSIQRLYNNSPQISYPTVTTSGALPKSYGMDGPMTAYANGTHTWLYAPMRRGGRVLYAFDVTTPGSPKLKWKVGCPNNFPTTGTVDDTGCSTSFTGIGQAWSSAKVIQAAGYGGGASPMIIMGGGYDTCEDSDPNTCTASTKGNKVYVLDAGSGTLLTTFSTTRAVIAEIAIAPDSNGLALYGYVADLGGNIYRITMGSSAPASWTMTQIASLGCATVTACTANRKFMFAPDLVAANGVYTLLLGSGDREKPLLYTALGTPVSSVVNSVTNYFFAVEDSPGSTTWLSSEAGNCSGVSIICLNSLLPVTSSTPPSSSSLAAKKGWYLSLNPTEQVVTSAITIYGTIYFSTHTPAVPMPNSCTSSLGTTRLYNPPFAAPAISATVLPPVGLPPSPVAGLVQLNGGQTVPFCIGCSASSPLQSTEPQAAPGTVPAQPKARVYWYIQR
jgi:type IV pilus assembly protein PilY1